MLLSSSSKRYISEWRQERPIRKNGIQELQHDQFCQPKSSTRSYLSKRKPHSSFHDLLHSLLIAHTSWRRTRSASRRGRPITRTTGTTARFRHPSHDDSSPACPQRPRFLGLPRPPLSNLTFLSLRNPPLFSFGLLVANTVDTSIILVWIVRVMSNDLRWLPPELGQFCITGTG